MRPRGLLIAGAGAAFIVLCYAPLALYVKFGPRDGNPIGLGLLALLGFGLGPPVVLVGALLAAYDLFRRGRR